MKLTAIFTLLISANIFCSNKEFVLITTLYNEKNETRAQEYIKCIDYNLQHKSIKKIHVLYDTSNNIPNNTILKYLKTKPIKLSFVKGRTTFGQCFNIANTSYPNQNIIIANADIYFNETLNYLDEYDLSDKFLCLTRWDVEPNGNLKYFANSIGSYDVWIFKTPIRKFLYDQIKLGTLNCDGAIAHQARVVGLKTSNPCKTVQCCHLHLSPIRNYSASRLNAIYGNDILPKITLAPQQQPNKEKI